MGWCHPDISLEDLVVLVKGFIDILILASGYQSSGLPAHWDSENIKKAIRWAIFFENVFRRLPNSDGYVDSVKELDAALSELTSNPCFPQGLAHLSSATLSRAREFVYGQFLQTLPLRDAHLIAVLTATIEMDLDDFSSDKKYYPIDLYIDQLTLLEKLPDGFPLKKGFIWEPDTPRVVSNIKVNKKSCGDNSKLVIQEVLKRHTAISCVSTVEKSLNVLSEIITKDHQIGTANNLWGGQICNNTSLEDGENLMGFVLHNHWRSRSLSYLLDKRTVSLISGASLIFSVPQVQWLQAFESLKAPTDARSDNLLEIIELSLLGSVSDRWSSLIEHFMSIPYDFVPISEQYHHVHNLLQERSEFLHSKGKPIRSKENDIVDYLSAFVDTQIHHLWRLPPVLAGAAISPGSTLFCIYMAEVDRQLNGDYSRIRCCHCSQDGKEHRDCEIAERIWCLYIFHVRGSSCRRMKRMFSNNRSVAVFKVQCKPTLLPWHGFSQLICRIRATWKQGMSSHGKRVSFSYDPLSYSQNFDNGLHLDCL